MFLSCNLLQRIDTCISSVSTQYFHNASFTTLYFISKLVILYFFRIISNIFIMSDVLIDLTQFSLSVSFIFFRITKTCFNFKCIINPYFKYINKLKELHINYIIQDNLDLYIKEYEDNKYLEYYLKYKLNNILNTILNKLRRDE